MATICLLHPGAMGVTIGAAAASAGHHVRWVADGRSPETRQRATGAGLDEMPTLEAGLAGADVVVSVCPPAAATAVAAAVVAIGFRGTFVDANAVAPATMRSVAAVVTDGGATAVDGGIVGPPATGPGRTRLFLSGPGAADVGALFDGSWLEPVVLDAPIGAASATKVAYAAWTKGSSALLLAVAAYAEAEGVSGPLVEEWATSQPGLADRLAGTAAGTAPKAWRFEGELADSGRAFADVGLPDGFGAAAADIYRRLAGFRDRTDGVDVATAVRAILDDV